MRTASDRISYDDLYSRWERGNWRATEIDFSEDAREWQDVFTDFEREAALWNYALFFWGEDAVADGLSPYIDGLRSRSRSTFSQRSRWTRRVTRSSSAASCTRWPASAAPTPDRGWPPSSRV
jgi:hypothetical protein